ncbi:MAG: YraN family protein [Clostridia bacterium]|nr:YraN family protein [Clostridia bacterium]MBO5670041.1 YraN family protein [Clostridia bacterium]
MSKLRGRLGEELCAAYLRRRGYEILSVSYHSRYGEIDIIAAKGGIVAFTEVKLRENGTFAAALEAVDSHKRERIRRTALMWLSENGDALQPRFDVCEIYLPAGTDPARAKINYLENAFE